MVVEVEDKKTELAKAVDLAVVEPIQAVEYLVKVTQVLKAGRVLLIKVVVAVVQEQLLWMHKIVQEVMGVLELQLPLAAQ